MSAKVVRKLVALSVMGALCVASPAKAHRLDEYLQQTLIELEPNRIVLHVDLTPGVLVAGRVILTIDADRDGTLNAAEQAAYTERVRRDLSLSVNGAELPLRATASTYPTIESMAQGMGTIALTFAATAPVRGTLRFANHHASARASYLVNCLQPQAREIRIISQSRAPDQSTYEVALAVER